MRAILTVAILFALCAPAARATDNDFKDIVRTLSYEFHKEPMRIPMFGLVNMVTFVARPAGTKHIDLAVFEDVHFEGRDSNELTRAVKRAVGRSWKPFVEVHSNRSGEITLVYMRPEGHDCRLLVTTIERTEATVVQLKLNPDGLQKWVNAPRESAGMHHGSAE